MKLSILLPLSILMIKSILIIKSTLILQFEATFTISRIPQLRCYSLDVAKYKIYNDQELM